MLQDHESSRILVNTVCNHKVQNSELYNNEKITQSICCGTIWREISDKYFAEMTMENPIIINGFNFTDDAVNLVVTNQCSLVKISGAGELREWTSVEQATHWCTTAHRSSKRTNHPRLAQVSAKNPANPSLRFAKQLSAVPGLRNSWHHWRAFYF